MSLAHLIVLANQILPKVLWLQKGGAYSDAKGIIKSQTQRGLYLVVLKKADALYSRTVTLPIQ